MIGKKLNAEKIVMVDCDETLVNYNLSDFPDFPTIELQGREPIRVVVNRKNVNLIRKLYKLNYDIVIWSATGANWAETVAKGVGLDDVAALYMSKPRYYVDDLDSSKFMGPRLWRDAITGKSDE